MNTARGAVIDEAALVKALDDGHVASAGLDVYENEPQIHPGLLANPHVMLVPHMGTWTIEVRRSFPSFRHSPSKTPRRNEVAMRAEHKTELPGSWSNANVLTGRAFPILFFSVPLFRALSQRRRSEADFC